jgi:hypothetical protein
MYAHVNIWTLSASGATSENTAAVKIAEAPEQFASVVSAVRTLLKLIVEA